MASGSRYEQLRDDSANSTETARLLTGLGRAVHLADQG